MLIWRAIEPAGDRVGDRPRIPVGVRLSDRGVQTILCRTLRQMTLTKALVTARIERPFQLRCVLVRVRSERKDQGIVPMTFFKVMRAPEIRIGCNLCIGMLQQAKVRLPTSMFLLPTCLFAVSSRKVRRHDCQFRSIAYPRTPASRQSVVRLEAAAQRGRSAGVTPDLLDLAWVPKQVVVAASFSFWDWLQGKSSDGPPTQ